MRVKVISAEEVQRLSVRGEDHFFDRKAFGVSGKKCQKIAVAFANADGGEFVIGIADDEDEPDPAKRWKGVPKIEDFNQCLQAVAEVAPALPIECTILKSDDIAGCVLLVAVEKSASVHNTADRTVYVRLGAQSLPVTDPQRIMELSFAKGATTYEDQVLQDAIAEDIAESRELQDFLHDFSPKTDPLEFVINQNLVERQNWKPRAAGILLFNANPSAVIPKKCAVKIARYETKEDDPDRDHLKETFTVEGPMYRVIHQTVDRIKEVMSSISVWTASGLKTMEYPQEAIWEIVVNAIIHRDYSISDDVQILIFSNRIEVISPGKLPGYVTPENILEARHSRNPKIVRALNRYKNAPNKDLGEGLNTAFRRMKEWKLRDPEIVVDGNSVRVIIPHTPLARPTELILEFLSKNLTITNRQARELTGIRSENLVKLEFYKLREEGLIEMVPGLKGPSSAWRRITLSA